MRLNIRGKNAFEMKDFFEKVISVRKIPEFDFLFCDFKRCCYITRTNKTLESFILHSAVDETDQLLFKTNRTSAEKKLFTLCNVQNKVFSMKNT